MIYPRDEQATTAVARHYDELSDYYLKIWGEHVHHGLWLEGHETTEAALCQTVAVLAERTGISSGESVCDVGCGYGGTARMLAADCGAKVAGFTISRQQWLYAESRTPRNAAPKFVLCDWLDNDLADASFDVVISIESSEHVADKARFFEEAYRTLRPSGRIGVYAWLARDEPSAWETKRLLEPICQEGRLPSMGNVTEYRTFLADAGFRHVRFEDFTRQVRKTWAVCAWRLAKLAATDVHAWGFLSTGPADRVFVKTVVRIWLAYWLGSMQYGLFTGHKLA